MWEVGLILLVALIVLGPQQLVEVARTLGKLYRDLQKMAWDLRNSIDLDSITSLEPDPHKPDKENTDTVGTINMDKELFPPAGEKSGPDFYADLLEATEKGGEGTEAGAPESPETREEGSPAKKEVTENAKS